MATYNYLDQAIQSTCLIEPKSNDSFYYPLSTSNTLGHTGFAWDGTLYIEGVQQYTIASPPALIYASWYSEAQGDYRGGTPTFPQTGLILLSRAALTILDGSTSALTLWMQFLIQNQFALANNFSENLNNGWTPSSLTYADGVLSVTCTPDTGNNIVGEGYNVDSNMVINIDFSQDKVYIDVAV
jgi:hypothetical protein